MPIGCSAPDDSRSSPRTTPRPPSRDRALSAGMHPTLHIVDHSIDGAPAEPTDPRDIGTTDVVVLAHHAALGDRRTGALYGLRERPTVPLPPLRWSEAPPSTRRTSVPSPATHRYVMGGPGADRGDRLGPNRLRSSISPSGSPSIPRRPSGCRRWPNWSRCHVRAVPPPRSRCGRSSTICSTASASRCGAARRSICAFDVRGEMDLHAAPRGHGGSARRPLPSNDSACPSARPTARSGRTRLRCSNVGIRWSVHRIPFRKATARPMWSCGCSNGCGARSAAKCAPYEHTSRGEHSLHVAGVLRAH